MRTKVTLVLVFLNVALFFFIFYIHPRLIVMDDLDKARRRVLPSSTLDLQAIEIKAAESATRLVRRGDTWNLTQPVDWPANNHAVSGIITQLQLLEHETDFDVASLAKSHLSLATYGLEKPVLTVTLFPASPRATPGAQAAAPVVLRIGNATNTANLLYVLSPDGKRVHVVNRALSDSLLVPLDQLRADAVFAIPAFEVRSFNIQYPPPTQRVWVQRDDSRWTLESPVRARASGHEVGLALAGLAGLRIGEFVTQPAAPELSPATAPLFRITLAGNNRSETLLIGGAVPAPAAPAAPAPAPATAAPATPASPLLHYAQVDGRATLFTLALPANLAETLRVAQERLRETRLLEFDPAQIGSIVLRNPAQGELSLQRLRGAATAESSSWQVVRRVGDAAPFIQPADTAAVQKLLEQLARLSVLKFVNDAPDSAAREAWGFNSPERSISLQFDSAQGGARPDTPAALKLEIGVGAERGPRAYARLDSADYVYQVDAEILRNTPVDARSWRNRTLLELPAGARVSSLSFTELPGGKVMEKIELPADKALPSETPHAAEWQKLASGLRALRARTFALDHYAESVVALGAEHPWKYRLDMTVELSSGNGSQTTRQSFFLTERIGGTLQFAGSKELDAVFELEQEMIDPLWTILYGARDPGPVAPATAAKP
jgi:hypothetical protein